VFTAIGEGHDTPAALAGRCVAAEMGIRVLCDFLVAIGLLELTEGHYVAAPDTAIYLDRHSPAFIGDALNFVASDTVLKAVLSDPTTVVRHGRSILADHFGAPDQTDWTTYADSRADDGGVGCLPRRSRDKRQRPCRREFHHDRHQERIAGIG
jgi:hypothetical protein